MGTKSGDFKSLKGKSLYSIYNSVMPGNGKKNKKSVSKAVKTYVKSAIKQKEETKISANFKEDAFAIAGYDVGTKLTSIEVLSDALDLSQGTGQGDRVGNQVRPVRFIMRGHIIGTTTNPVLIRMIIFRGKQDINSPTDLSNLFQAGNSVSAPTNLPSDMYLPLNRNDYIIYKDRHFSVTAENTGGIAGANGTNLIQFFKQDLVKYLPKKLIYADTAVDATNCGLYMTFLVCRQDGGVLSSPTLGKADMAYSLSLEYKDS